MKKFIVIVITSSFLLSCSHSKKAKKSTCPTGESSPAYLGIRIDRIGEEDYDDGHFINIDKDTLFIHNQKWSHLNK